MKCPRCGTHVLVLRDEEQTGQVASHEFGRWELRVCLRCLGGWADYPKVVEVLKRFQLVEFRGHEHRLHVCGERLEPRP